MEGILVVLLAVATGAAYLTLVWSTTESREIRFWAVWAVVGSLLLGIAWVFASLCGLAENRSELFYERCEGSVPYIPLYAIPPLLVMPFLRRFLSAPAVLLAGILLVVVVGFLIPKELLSV
ncbi:MAG: hypothetical protein ACJ76B_04580 [Solirubrobacterales bacterium]